MKYFVLSDVHGCITYLESALKKFESSNCDKIILLGDVLNHGPRNPLIDEYNPSKVIEILNNLKSKIIAVRGNCDSEVDQMCLEFPMMADYTIINFPKLSIFVTHGHLYNEEMLPELNPNDAILYGHFHVPIAKKENEVYILNPGSITYPKQNSKNSYGILTDSSFTVLDLEENIQAEIKF